MLGLEMRSAGNDMSIVRGALEIPCFATAGAQWFLHRVCVADIGLQNWGRV